MEESEELEEKSKTTKQDHRKDITFEDADIPFEEEILRHPYSVKCWMKYIEHKQLTGSDWTTSSSSSVNLIYERALRVLPGSYKLWYYYLKIRRQQVRGKCVTDPVYEDVNNAFERSLVFLHRMPRVWMDYCQFLTEQNKITRTRRTFDRSLRSLPLTQHKRIWPLYIKFLRQHNIPETTVRVYRRYLQLCPENSEEFIDYLIMIGRLDEAAIKLAEIVNKESFVSKEGKSKFQLWYELCELIAKNPDRVTSLNVEAIIRGGIKRFTDMVGQLWCSLADYHIRAGRFERGRDIYNEAIQSVITVRDFTQIFDAYSQYEETMIQSKMESTTELTEEDEIELELRLSRFENLMDTRPVLLSSVLLRQNPHNVHEWHKRVGLFDGRPADIIKTYTEAVQTVDIQQAIGKPHTLWTAFAQFYENNNQLPEARVIFDKATKVQFKSVDDLANVWCEYAEMELRHENYDRALQLMQRATAVPPKRAAYYDKSEPVQNRLYKNLKVWSMYADLEESLGTFETTKAVYNRIIDLKIATPQTVLNFCSFLEENNYYEESFKAYERGISLFRWPHVNELWKDYLSKFIKRYGGKKLERARDLFEQALDGCPAEYAQNLYLLYAKLEEDYGLTRRAMSVYERATEAVLPEEQYDMFCIYIKRASEAFGIVQTRSIHEKAIEVLPEGPAREMCLSYAQLETKLGEIDRARAIYSHGSQFSDPRTAKKYWKEWQEFEVRHGNEDTFREMLRIKRSVQAQYNTQVNFMSSQMVSSTTKQAMAAAQDDMKLLEEKARAVSEETKRDKTKTKTMSFVKSTEATAEMEELARKANPDEINIAEDDDEETQPVEEIQIEKQTIPSTVFGGLSDDNLGARERLAAKRKR